MNPLSAHPDVIRPAAIEIRAVNQEQYDAIVNAYTSFSEKRTEIPGGVSFESGDKEVRVTLKNLDKQNLAIVYWEVKGKKIEDIRATYEEWIKKYKYSPVDTPEQDGELVGADNLPTCSGILKQENSRIGSSNQFGIVINPPYPRIVDVDPGPGSPFINYGNGIALSTILLFVGIGLVIGVAIGWLLKR